jgi:hypothetical protein
MDNRNNNRQMMENFTKKLTEEHIDEVNFGDAKQWETYFPKSAYNHYEQVRLDIGNQGVRHKDLEKLRTDAHRAITLMLKEIKKQYKLA